MNSALRQSLGVLGLSLALLGGPALGRSQARLQDGNELSQNVQNKEVPKGVILVKGAWSGASDSTTPLPEQGSIANDIYRNPYFGLAYAVAPGWTQKYYGAPPSETGYYVLAQIAPADTNKGPRGSVLIAAQDLFFTLTPGANALELMSNTEAGLQPDYKVERPLAPVSIANHSFLSLEYFSPVAELHWYVLATQVRCHLIQFVFTSRDTELIESLVQGMKKVKPPAQAGPILDTGGNDVPVCIKDYARAENMLERVDPAFTEPRFNAIPVRIVIDREGKVKHIHFLSAFADQQKSITDALSQWRFKPYVQDGRPLEVETGILFGRAPRPVPPSASDRGHE